MHYPGGQRLKDFGSLGGGFPPVKNNNAGFTHIRLRESLGLEKPSALHVTQKALQLSFCDNFLMSWFFLAGAGQVAGSSAANRCPHARGEYPVFSPGLTSAGNSYRNNSDHVLLPRQQSNTLRRINFSFQSCTLQFVRHLLEKQPSMPGAKWRLGLPEHFTSPWPPATRQRGRELARHLKR
jgi:hypothetical protein